MKKLFALTICFVFVGVASGQDEPSRFLESLQKGTWEIGPEIYYFKYEEPGFNLEWEGMFYGLAAAYTHRDWVPASQEESAPDGKWMWRGEGRFAYGQVDYDGALNDGTPYTIDNIDDYALEFRLLLGPDFPKQTSMNTLYAGIGYRYLNDDASFDPAGYERESNYLYIPVGIKTISDLKNGWSFGATAEFDLFLWGEQNSHLSDVGGVDIQNEQDSGYGLRGSIKFHKKSKKTDFIIEPFIRYWNIDKSDVVLGVYEPENETLEYGIQFIWRF